MIRRADWEQRLADYLGPLRALPHRWGTHDCCTFCAGAVLAMTGVDPMPEFRGRYATERGSLIALRRLGAGTLEATLDTKFVRIPPALAHRGDLVLIGGSLALCFGAFATAPGVDPERVGLVRLPRGDDWTAAWRVPFVGEAA